MSSALTRVVDAFIPSRVSKEGKKSAFACFIKVKNLEVLVGHLNTIWIGFENMMIRYLGGYLVSLEFPDVHAHGEESKESVSYTDIYLGVQEQECVNMENMGKNIDNNEDKSDDPFNIYNLLNQANQKVDKEPVVSDDPSKPLGFTKIIEEGNNENVKGDNDVNGNECPYENNTMPQEWVRYIKENHKFEFKMTWIKWWHGEVIVMGDFNEVRIPSERFGLNFNKQGATMFNSFIETSCLIDIPLGRYSFTWALKDAGKMSKLDRPIILKQTSTDYGPTPFRMFHSSFSIDGFEQLVKIKSWAHHNRAMDNIKRKEIQKELKIIDKKIDQDGGQEGLLNSRRDLWKKLQDIDFTNKKDLVQKAKIRYTNEVVFPTTLSHDQMIMLEVEIMNLEIKKAGWDCGSNTSSGPDGYTFEFIRTFWEVIGDDVCRTAKSFFTTGRFPKGCNPSFIALIPKVNDVKVVKDYLPISLIGCQYKIVGKILANRLCMVMDSLISKEQFAFIRDHQILDGPIILSEVVQWCLRINIKKCRLMRVGGVNFEDVCIGASLIGCEAAKTPFIYLGVLVRKKMARIQSWDVVINKIVARLSKWKEKTLSIGGRFTLIKSVLSALPTYYFSIFKVLVGVLKRLEVIRSKVFRGVDADSRMISWFSLDKVIASKDCGGLGMSSFYAMNRALLFKCIWRFKTQIDALWVLVIKEIHEACGNLDKDVQVGNLSPWLECIRSMVHLKTKGVDLLSCITKTVGNGNNTSFWLENWAECGVLKTKFPRLFALEENKEATIFETI
ncbi:RNA-directed DNA polymerase, eukaryota, reverse transcriptase zinc-binding domain protein [Tanacetum coccineum]